MHFNLNTNDNDSYVAKVLLGTLYLREFIKDGKSLDLYFCLSHNDTDLFIETSYDATTKSYNYGYIINDEFVSGNYILTDKALMVDINYYVTCILDVALNRLELFHSENCS